MTFQVNDPVAVTIYGSRHQPTLYYGIVLATRYIGGERCHMVRYTTGHRSWVSEWRMAIYRHGKKVNQL